MDYAGILKRAWNVTWNHKILWLFGLFAGASAGVNGNSFNTSSFNNGGSTTSAQSFSLWLPASPGGGLVGSTCRPHPVPRRSRGVVHRLTSAPAARSSSTIAWATSAVDP